MELSLVICSLFNLTFWVRTSRARMKVDLSEANLKYQKNVWSTEIRKKVYNLFFCQARKKKILLNKQGLSSLDRIFGKELN